MERTLFGIIGLSLALGVLGVFAKSEGAYVPPPAAQAPRAETPSATILFAGDIMLDRYIRQVAEAKGGQYIFSCIAPTLHSVEVVVANLEGPITENPSVSVGTNETMPGHFTFTFPPSSAPLLFQNNIRIVSLGNNHSTNFGFDGVASTTKYLSEAGVQYFGDPRAAEADRVLRTDVHGIPVSFVNWSDWTSDNTDHTVAQVREEKESGRVVFVFNHWGDEYVPPPERVKELAHQFVDAGADLVVGTHPHIVQEHELYKGKYIYYSIGNFIFDQHFDTFVSHGLLLEVTFTKEGVSKLGEIPVTLEKDGRTCPGIY